MAHNDDKRRGRSEEEGTEDELADEPAAPGSEDEDEEEEPDLGEVESEERDWS